MSPINVFKNWLLRKMAPYIELDRKQANKTSSSTFRAEHYSDLNEDTEYSS